MPELLDFQAFRGTIALGKIPLRERSFSPFVATAAYSTFRSHLWESPWFNITFTLRFFTNNLHTLGTNKFCIQSFQQTIIIIELFPGSIIVSREGERTTEIASQKKKKIQRNQKRKSIPLLFTSVFATFSEADVAHEATLLEKQFREHYSQFIDKLVKDK